MKYKVVIQHTLQLSCNTKPEGGNVKISLSQDLVSESRIIVLQLRNIYTVFFFVFLLLLFFFFLTD